MGIYLFPVCPEDVWEKLAGVPSGTAARFTRFKQAVAHHRWVFSTAAYASAAQVAGDGLPDEGELVFWEIEHDPDLCRFNHFKLAGWGKVRPATWSLIQLVCPTVEPIGTLTNQAIIAAVLANQGIELPTSILTRLEGLTWA